MIKTSLILFVSILSFNALQYNRNCEMNQLEHVDLITDEKKNVIKKKSTSTILKINQDLFYQHSVNTAFSQLLTPIEINLGSDLSKQFTCSIESVDFSFNGKHNAYFQKNLKLSANEVMLKMLVGNLVDDKYLIDSITVNESNINIRVLNLKNLEDLEKSNQIYKQGVFNYTSNQNENQILNKVQNHLQNQIKNQNNANIKKKILL